VVALLVAAATASTTIGYASVAGVSPFQVLLCAAVVSLLIIRPSRVAVSARSVGALIVPAMVLLAMCLLSLVEVAEPSRGLAYVRSWTGGLAFAVTAIAVIRTRRRSSALAGLLILLTIGGAALAVLQAYLSARFSLVPFLSNPSDPYVQYFTEEVVLQRPTGWAKMGFELAIDMIPGASLGLAVAMFGRSWRRLGFIAWLAGTFAIALSGLRSGWLGLGCATGFIIVVGARCSRRVRFAMLLAVLSGAVVIAMTISERVSARVQERAGVNLRLAQFRAATEMVNDHPLLGVGIGTVSARFAHYLPSYTATEVVDARRAVSPHNVFMEIWAGAGPVALIAFLIVIAEAVRSAIAVTAATEDPQLHALGIGTAAAVIGVTIDYGFHNHAFDKNLWVLIGLAHALWRARGTFGPPNAVEVPHRA